jgi:hypothetical protein
MARPRTFKYVQMDEILDAMATRRPGSPTFYLDTETGRVELSLDSSADPDDGRYQQVPRIRTRARRQRLLEEALAWLARIGIEPQYELRAPTRPPTRKRKVRQSVGFLDLLLLGTPPGPTERRDGRVERRLIAPSREQARETFATVARDLCTHHGRRWRARTIENRDRYELDRFTVRISDREVVLSVAVPAAIWELFHPR